MILVPGDFTFINLKWSVCSTLRGKRAGAPSSTASVWGGVLPSGALPSAEENRRGHLQGAAYPQKQKSGASQRQTGPLPWEHFCTSPRGSRNSSKPLLISSSCSWVLRPGEDTQGSPKRSYKATSLSCWHSLFPHLLIPPQQLNSLLSA